MVAELLERFRAGDRRALSRLLTLASRGEHAEAIRAGLPRVPPARVVAVTGAGGVGKSTLVGALIGAARAAGRRVAVLACDPQSPLSGGALLGDRFRMPARPDDDGVFVRSLAAAGGQGAVAGHLDLLIGLAEAFGFDAVLVETVGAGQGDTAVRPLVDVLVLLLQPETGDDLQWEKAGLLEVADLVVVHKADLPGAERVEAQVLASLGLAHHAPPVLRASARTGYGIAEVWRAMEGLPMRRGTRADAGRLLRLAQDLLAARFQAEGAVVEAWRRGELDDAAAARRVVEELASS
ncbi:MAG: methylmalonyl Co-A mutase-associated GTPase MeaB [Gemmataceae bacterium]